MERSAIRGSVGRNHRSRISLRSIRATWRRVSRRQRRPSTFGRQEPMTSPVTLSNPVKQRLAAGEPALGLNVRLARSPDVARIAKATGHDFIFIDTQHSIFDLETIANMAHTALAIGVAPLVRVRGID